MTINPFLIGVTMNLTTLEYFVQVATEGSLTKAADKLFISQPTLSRHMKNLEAELNTQLFVRQSHSLKLTENGITFLKATTKVIQDVDALKHFFDQHQTASNPTHYLNVGYLENFRLEKMYAVLDRISHENNIQFSLFPDTPTNLSKGLSSGKYDLIYSLRPYTTDNVLFKSTDFLENHLQIALPINHPLAAKPQLSFSD